MVYTRSRGVLRGSIRVSTGHDVIKKLDAASKGRRAKVHTDCRMHKREDTMEFGL